MLRYIALFYFIVITHQQIYYEPQKNSDLVIDRLLGIMRNYAEETKNRVGAMTPYRSYYEYTAHFELGYTIAELLERYRKMVGTLKSPYYESDQRSSSLPQVIKKCDNVQKYFIEIYEISNMIHEIERKYETELLAGDGDIQVETEADRAKRIQDIQRRIEKAQRARLRAKKRRDKLRRQRMKMNLTAMRFEETNWKPKNKWWPLEYGWEIDYYWR